MNTQVVEASGTGVSRTMTYGYDFHTGQVTSSTDVGRKPGTLLNYWNNLNWRFCNPLAMKVLE